MIVEQLKQTLAIVEKHEGMHGKGERCFTAGNTISLLRACKLLTSSKPL